MARACLRRLRRGCCTAARATARCGRSWGRRVGRPCEYVSAGRVASTQSMRQRPSRYQRRTPQDPRTRTDQSLAFQESWRPPPWFDDIAVVLVETKDAVNIGGVARAMANTGFRTLRLVRPAEFDPWQIIGIAHYTQYIVDATRLFDSLPAAVADRHFVLGLTGAHHSVARNQLALPEAIDRLV